MLTLLFERLSGILLFISFLLLKLPAFVNFSFLVGGYLTIAALSIQLLAYLVWTLMEAFYPTPDTKTPFLLPISHFKWQSIVAGIIGVLASALILAAQISVPILMIPGLGFLFVSNLLWCVGEYNRLQASPIKAEWHSQRYYLYFSIAITALSLLIIASYALTFIFPPLAITIYAVCTPLGYLIGLIGCSFWLAYAETDDPIVVQNDETGVQVLMECKGRRTSQSLPVYHLFTAKSDKDNCGKQRRRESIPQTRLGTSLKMDPRLRGDDTFCVKDY